MRRLIRVVLLVAVGATPAWAVVENLEEFLRSAEAQAHVAVPLRGDGQFQVVTPTATRHDQMMMLIRPPGDAFIALRQAGAKALVLGADSAMVNAAGGAPEKFAADTPFADSDFTREDLEPFRVSDYKDWRISDDSADELTVTMFPKDPQYSLVVMTFDVARKLPLKTLYYEETLSNLVKMRRDSDYVLVGQKWVPSSISMETFKLRRQTTLTLKWTQDGTVPPELFDPASLRRAVNLPWPAVTESAEKK